MTSIKERILKLPVRGKVASVLSIADSVLEELKKEDQEGYVIAKEATQLAWSWEEGKKVTGDQLSVYVDSPTDKDLGVRELEYDDEGMIGAIVAITLAIGYTAKQAYHFDNVKEMSTPIWEIDDNSISDVIENASESKFYSEEKLLDIISYLEKKYVADGPQDFGVLVTRDEIISLA